AHVIAEADCGVQVSQEDPAALAQVLADLADDPASRERMGQNARAFCEERYGFHRIGQQFHRIFTDVVTHNKNAAPDAGSRAAMPSIPSAKPKT
ncbi:MAG: glycosyltransferase, partial [Armatimonadetes bacterium]|nr:glycosyltransferase [Armatimonadota bacterium]